MRGLRSDELCSLGATQGNAEPCEDIGLERRVAVLIHLDPRIAQNPRRIHRELTIVALPCSHPFDGEKEFIGEREVNHRYISHPVLLVSNEHSRLVLTDLEQKADTAVKAIGDPARGRTVEDRSAFLGDNLAPRIFSFDQSEDDFFRFNVNFRKQVSDALLLNLYHLTVASPDDVPRQAYCAYGKSESGVFQELPHISSFFDRNYVENK